MWSPAFKLINRIPAFQQFSRQTSSISTIREVREKLKKLIGSPAVWSPAAKEDLACLSRMLPKSQKELPPRKMKDSYREAIIPLRSDQRLREKYLNFHQAVRFGRLLEDLDTFSVWIGYSHSTSGSAERSPIVVVTALVDRIELWRPHIHKDGNIKLSGNVTWVGKSSMEVSINMSQESDVAQEEWEDILQAKFLMVARDPYNKGQAYINPLVPEGPEGQAIFDRGQLAKAQRHEEIHKSLLNSPPTSEESRLIHNMFLETLDSHKATFQARVKPASSAWMEETKLKNVIVCFPQERNLYNKIFGGYLMRCGFELAWANACIFSKQRPHIRIVDDISFRRPVEIGDIVFLSSQIVYSKDAEMQVTVHAEVVNPRTGLHDTTNVFYFTFFAHEPVPRLVPKTYADAMLYIDGRRHFLA